jgi:hypothetical protein
LPPRWCSDGALWPFLGSPGREGRPREEGEAVEDLYRRGAQWLAGGVLER